MALKSFFGYISEQIGVAPMLCTYIPGNRFRIWGGLQAILSYPWFSSVSLNTSKYSMTTEYLHSCHSCIIFHLIWRYIMFCDITPSSPLKGNQRFGGACRLHLQGLINQEIIQHETCSNQSPWRRRRHISLKNTLTFNRLHGIMSQKIEFFITTGVRTTNPT
jgi:hypothetical protein